MQSILWPPIRREGSHNNHWQNLTYKLLTLIVMWSCETSENVWPVLRDNTSRFWQALRMSTMLTCPSDDSSSNVVIGPVWARQSHVQAMCDWVKLHDSIVWTTRGNSNTTTPARRSQTVRVPEFRPQVNRHCSSAKNRREISSLVDRPVINHNASSNTKSQ